MYKLTVYVPYQYNDRTPIATEIHENFMGDVLKIAGGYTLGQDVLGEYRMRDGTIAADRLFTISVSVNGEKERSELFGRIKLLAYECRQESVYVEETYPRVHFVEP